MDCSKMGEIGGGRLEKGKSGFVFICLLTIFIPNNFGLSVLLISFSYIMSKKSNHFHRKLFNFDESVIHHRLPSLPSAKTSLLVCFISIPSNLLTPICYVLIFVVLIIPMGSQAVILVNCMKQQGGFAWESNKYYRSRPSLYETTVLGNYLLDIEGTLLFIYELEGIVFKKSIEVLHKDDQFCAKIRPLSDNLVVVFGMYKFTIVSIEKLQVIESVEIEAMIENVDAKNGYISILTSDEEGENKLMFCWKIGKEGKVERRYEPVDVRLPEFEECSEERLEVAIIESIDSTPKVYLFWRGTNNMLEIDPIRKLEERYNRIKELSWVADIDRDTYSEISDNKITLCSKKGGKEIGSFTNEKELFKKVISKNGETNEYYSISNQGVKRWKLENNAEPLFYAESDKYPIENLYLTTNGQLVGINLEKKTIIVWKNDKDLIIHNFPNEIIRKILRINDTQVCLMLEATISRQVENEYQVEKHNKMEIYDFEKEKDVAKKAVLKLEYKIDIDSSIVGNDGSILFILNEDAEGEVKKYIFKWTPFTEEKKKEVKKREIIGAKLFDFIKLYPYDRIVTFKKAKETEMYDLFGKATQSKSQVTLFDFNAKKIGEYDLSADIKQLELSSNNQLYALGKDKFSIYEINPTSKNRLEKIHELEVTVSFVYPLDNYILMKKDSSILIYDRDFELLMKEDEDEDIEDYRIMKIDAHRFVLASKKDFSLWDLEKEEKTTLALEGSPPNLVELMGKRHLLVADKWIRSYDFQLLRQ